MLPLMLVLLAGLPPARQILPIERAQIEFSSAARVPGVTLEPGAYIFAPGYPVAGQLVIDIYRVSDMTIVASVLAVETSVLRSSASTLVDYPRTSPPYLRAWFHRAFRHGYEFVYHPEEAAGIFAASGETVPAAVFRGATTLMGLMPIDHIDDLYRGGRPQTAAGQFAADGVVPGPIDQLTLARLAILAHLPEAAPDIAFRLALLDRQIAALIAAYEQDAADVPKYLSLVIATLNNSIFPQRQELAHVIERVRERVRVFAEFLTARIPTPPRPAAGR